MKNLNKTQIIITMGSGGVGKTSLSAAMGYLTAKNGKKTLVLTIDPSLRLAAALSITADGEIHAVPWGAKDKTSGEALFYASVIQSKKIFDTFVNQYAKNPNLAQRILNNPLYIELSTTLSGSQEFTALERLLSVYESGEFDVIILDTPPAQHAIDFLKAPVKIAQIFGKNIAKWFRDQNPEKNSWVTRIIQSGTLKVLMALKLLTGSDFVDHLRDFFEAIEGWQEKLEERSLRIKELLLSQNTRFVLVTSFEAAKLKEAEYYAEVLKKEGFKLERIFINRAYPDWLPQPQLKGDTPIAKISQNLSLYYQQKSNSLKPIMDLHSNVVIDFIPEFTNQLSDEESLKRLEPYLLKSLF